MNGRDSQYEAISKEIGSTHGYGESSPSVTVYDTETTKSIPAHLASVLVAEGIPYLDLSQVKLEHKLGSGAMSTVHRATYGNVAIAVKVGKPAVEREKLLKSLVTDATYLRKIRRSTGLFAADIAQTMLAMNPYELTLERSLQSSQTLFLSRNQMRIRCGLVAQLAEAIAEMSNAGIVHRDLKPGNLLMNPLQGDLHVSDFGLAAIDGELQDDEDPKGTPRYMTPEQIENPLIPTIASNVYGLGLIAYDIFHPQHDPLLQYPDDTEITPLSIMKKVPEQKGFSESIKGVARSYFGVGKGIRTFLTGCLEKDVGSRFDHVKAVTEIRRIATCLNAETLGWRDMVSILGHKALSTLNRKF